LFRVLSSMGHFGSSFYFDINVLVWYLLYRPLMLFWCISFSSSETKIDVYIMEFSGYLFFCILNILQLNIRVHILMKYMYIVKSLFSLNARISHFDVIASSLLIVFLILRICFALFPDASYWSVPQMLFYSLIVHCYWWVNQILVF